MELVLGRGIGSFSMHKEPEKKPNPTLEEFDHMVELLESANDVVMDAIEDCEQDIKDFFAQFPPSGLYRVKEGAPYKFTVEDSIVVVGGVVEKNEGGVFADVMVVYSPIGHYGYRASVDPKYLERIGTEVVRERFMKITDEVLEDNRMSALARLCKIQSRLTETMGLEACCVCKKGGYRNEEGKVPEVVIAKIAELVNEECERIRKDSDRT